ncbi:MAG: GEVED domain-containing protein [Bacteroidia bacterium]|nr:GEVED domain-containing protein [Bacteroidia bacterium]
MTAVYIDYNHNWNLLDSGETVYTKSYGTGSLPSYVVNSSFIVPMSADTGQTLMRIVYSEDSSISHCSSYFLPVKQKTT